MEKPSVSKEYVGDGVYVEVNKHNQLVVTTEDGVAVTNTVYFEPEVWETLIAWASRNWKFR